LLEAIRPLDMLLLIAGDGSCRDDLEKYMHANGIAHKVRLLGRRDDVPQLLPAFDVFAQTSTSESFGLAVIEALLAGTPVVATAVGAIPEVTDNGCFATLIPLGDVDAFRQALMQVQADSTAASILAQASRPFIEAQYSAASATAVLHQLYRDVLS
jgi:glycosyltransferase involved in cell wall biosynthesis